jgi:hypothetical protein
MTARPRRNGMIAVAVLMALMVVAMLLTILIRSAILHRVALAKAERRLQAEMLAESGVERAAAKLSASGDYSGETWEIKASELGRRDDASVVILVERVDGRPDRRRVDVQADYPRPVERRARVSKTILIDLKRTPRTDKGAMP